MTAPVIAFTNASGTPIASLALTGTGAGGAVVAGTTSTAATIRIYNNKGGGGTISDAFSCVLAAYDNATIPNGAATLPISGTWLQVLVNDYNGTTTGQDTVYTAIGGGQAHGVPVNGGRIVGGVGGNYITTFVQVAVPITGSAAAYSPGLWLLYSYT